MGEGSPKADLHPQSFESYKLTLEASPLVDKKSWSKLKTILGVHRLRCPDNSAIRPTARTKMVECAKHWYRFWYKVAWYILSVWMPNGQPASTVSPLQSGWLRHGVLPLPRPLLSLQILPDHSQQPWNFFGDVSVCKQCTWQLMRHLLNFLPQPPHMISWHLIKFHDFRTSFAFYRI